MTQSELIQIQKIKKFNTTEKEYFDIISENSGTYLSMYSYGTPAGQESNHKSDEDFGQNIGIAFQIKDDLLDYSTKGFTGKIPAMISGGKAYATSDTQFKKASFIDQRKSSRL